MKNEKILVSFIFLLLSNYITWSSYSYDITNYRTNCDFSKEIFLVDKSDKDVKKCNSGNSKRKAQTSCIQNKVCNKKTGNDKKICTMEANYLAHDKKQLSVSKTQAQIQKDSENLNVSKESNAEIKKYSQMSVWLGVGQAFLPLLLQIIQSVFSYELADLDCPSPTALVMNMSGLAASLWQLYMFASDIFKTKALNEKFQNDIKAKNVDEQKLSYEFLIDRQNLTIEGSLNNTEMLTMITATDLLGLATSIYEYYEVAAQGGAQVICPPTGDKFLSLVYRCKECASYREMTRKSITDPQGAGLSPENEQDAQLRTQLERNRKKTAENVEGYLRGNQEGPEGKRDNESIEEYFERIQNEQEAAAMNAMSGIDPNYTEAIARLGEMKDARSHIAHTVKENENGQPSDLIRDARWAVEQPELAPEAYAMQYLNSCRAAERLVSDHPHRGIFEQRIRRSAREVMFMLKRGEPIIIEDENKNLVRLLEEPAIALSSEGWERFEGVKQINEAKDFASFEDEHYNLTTIWRAEDSPESPVVIESAEMMSAMTKRQRDIYEAIGRGDDEKTLEDKFGHEVTWFTKAKPETKKLIRHYADSIASGRKVIPSQLRGQLLGLKNAYEKTTSVSMPDGSDTEVLVRTMHAGTISFHGKGNGMAATRLNSAQLRAYAGGDTNINVLNSPVVIDPRGAKPFEYSLAEQTKYAQSATGGQVSVAPVNIFRRLTIENDNSGFNAALGEVSRVSEAAGLDSLTHYLKTGRGRSAAQEQLAKFRSNPDDFHQGLKGVDHEKLATAFEHALHAREKMTGWRREGDGTNRNIELSSDMKLVAHAAEEGGILHTAATRMKIDSPQVERILSFCASGKDRTGIVEFDTSRKAINDGIRRYISDHYPKNSTREALIASITEDNLLDRQVDAGHTQEIPGRQGGTVGSYGIKFDTKTQFGSTYERVKNRLSQDYALFNKFKKTRAPDRKRINKFK